MAIIKFKPVSPAQRHMSTLRVASLSNKEPERRLITVLKKNSGRNNTGRITVRHQGGGSRRFLCMIDFKRSKRDILATVAALEYDPNRTSYIALLSYADGEKSYIIAPENLAVGDKVLASDTADFTAGNTLPLSKIPVGMPIHNLELRQGKGGQIVRSAGSAAIIQSKENGFATVLLPSSEVRRIPLDCCATIGRVSNSDWQNISWGKAGKSRHRGIRPSVRGLAMAPNAHPHGGGEGRSGIGMPSPKSPWGKPTLGYRTRKRRKYSDKYIITRRKK
jgi:large subunit ribosomal protein L2